MPRVPHHHDPQQDPFLAYYVPFVVAVLLALAFTTLGPALNHKLQRAAQAISLLHQSL